MNSTNDPDDRSTAGREVASQVAFSAAIGSAMMLYVGFGYGLTGISESSVYNLATDGFTWVMKIGGILMGIAALLCWAGWTPALAFDAILTAAIGIVLLVCGAIWLVHADFQGLLLVLFAVMFGSSAYRSWQAFSGLRRPAPAVPGGSALIDGAAASEGATEGLKASARERLLQAKANLRSPSPAVDPEQAGAVSPPPVEVTLPPVEPAESKASLPPAKVDELPEEGFLAELGRQGRIERK